MASDSANRPRMERGLHDRDRAGVQDFVLLENIQSEEAFIGNLRKRFQENLIYTYIGQVLISVNPYKQLPIYSENDIKEYRNKHFYEMPPHIFAVTDNAFRSLIEENKGQCVLISGESGSGKTEASKKVLQYIAACSGHQSTVESVKEKLLKSNPVLEAFGNAKTNRNVNSSRFGKYMDIQFDYSGTPIGGHILNYLLEKSRVVNQNAGERNFHIFYQLLAGASEEELKRLQLKRSLDSYSYLSDGQNGVVKYIDDVADFNTVKQAMSVIDFTDSEQKDIFSIIASVLHLGNVTFNEAEGVAKVSKPDAVAAVAQLLGVSQNALTDALTNRTIDAQGDVVTSPLNRELSVYARDALAKAIYDRLFTWLVQRLNRSLQAKDLRDALNNVMGILDIYGFEIFKKNSFEQFCINFCNEKLQQLFIELTLKSEQDEYQREGIEWVPVEYFDNKVICNLIEEKYKGIISILDEECLRPGEPTDITFLAKLTDKLAAHPHYICHEKSSTLVQKTMGRDEFRLVHYAGDVTYNVNGFLDKNNDLLFRDLKETMSRAGNDIIRSCFPEGEYKNKKRPDTAITQFRNSLNNLMDILMCKEPSYIRCIKPNDQQQAGIFDDELVLHQVKYLGLMENLRVRRAGFAYRRTYETFLNRYKSLSKATWPNYKGSPKEGVRELVADLQYGPDDYRLGATKVFIRFPKTLFDTEDAFQVKKHDIAAIIQSRWKGRQQRRKYLKLRDQIITLQSYCRRYLAIQALRRRREAATKIRAFIKGFITRNDAPNGYNDEFIVNMKRMWLIRLSKQLPTEVLDKSWPSSPVHCQEASTYLHRLHRLHLARKYRLSLSDERKRQFELKVLAEKLFKDKKANYLASVPYWFQNDRIPKEHAAEINNFVGTSLNGETLKYASPCTKFDRHGYKPRERFVVLSNKALYVLDGKSYKQKHRLPLEKIDFVTTNHSDSLLVIRIPLELKKDKGDLILEIPYIVELGTLVVDTVGTANILSIVSRDTLEHNVVKGKAGVIDIQTGGEPGIVRDKGGHLVVIAGQ
ncbi:PREDICTED: myosin-IB isoform X2 [Rhagoletis zephyria]|uniref:myosin-IB isoform X1 n=2 Tax=Rhagoletis zephyria TaxID=28612 RepID=UPI0008117D29|nr:PREDICTED: myosin-IB isoform X1 [Rhagoletis zephyria]XP_017477185.1 PREDICTED: myosin-IB isoform X2 [Rhagoletis zephyria]